MKKFILIASILSLATATAAQTKFSKKERRAMALSSEQVAETVEVTGTGALDRYTWLSTREFIKYSGKSDRWLRARIDRNNQEVIYQIYTTFYSSEAIRPSYLSFESPEGPLQSKFIQNDYDVSCRKYGCTHFRSGVFIIPEETIKWAASDAQPGAEHSWNIKLFFQAQQGQETATLKTEIAGLLIAVERELEKLN